MSPRITPILTALRDTCPGSLTNQYVAEVGPDDAEGPEIRRDNVRRYLERRLDADILLVSQAPGAGGTRWSGVPLTTTRMLKVGILGDGFRWTREVTEMASEAVHDGIDDQEARVMLWSTVPWHPEGATPEKSRKPTPTEIEAGTQILRKVLDLKSWRAVGAIGKVASTALDGLGVAHEALPHPYYDGRERCTLAVQNFLQRHLHPHRTP